MAARGPSATTSATRDLRRSCGQLFSELTRIQQVTGLVSQLSKAAVYSQSGKYGAKPPSAVIGELGERKDEPGRWVGPVGRGIMAGGVSIGDDVFV